MNTCAVLHLLSASNTFAFEKRLRESATYRNILWAVFVPNYFKIYLCMIIVVDMKIRYDPVTIRF